MTGLTLCPIIRKWQLQAFPYKLSYIFQIIKLFQSWVFPNYDDLFFLFLLLAHKNLDSPWVISHHFKRKFSGFSSWNCARIWTKWPNSNWWRLMVVFFVRLLAKWAHFDDQGQQQQAGRHTWAWLMKEKSSYWNRASEKEFVMKT